MNERRIWRSGNALGKSGAVVARPVASAGAEARALAQRLEGAYHRTRARGFLGMPLVRRLSLLVDVGGLRVRELLGLP